MKKHLGYGALALLPFLPLLLGCPLPLPRGASRPPSPADLHVIDLLMGEGAARGLGSDRCNEERRERLVVVDADDATMRARVGYCARGSDACISTEGIADPNDRYLARARLGCLLGVCSGGSIAHAQDHVWPANLGRWRAEIYLSAYVDASTRRALLVHEGAHWLLACSGRGEDGRHAIPGIWEREGPTSLVLTVQRRLAAESSQ